LRIRRINMPNIRVDRVNSAIQKAVAKIINEDINDPRITGFVSVSSVKTSPDLAHAKIYLSILSKNRQEVFDVIKNAVGFIRKNVAKELAMRVTPELSFHLDEGQENEDNVNRILDSLKKGTENTNK